jgi:hypothetical protein
MDLNLGLRQGRYLKYAETGPNPYGAHGGGLGSTWGNYGSSSSGLGPSHNRLLVSLMNALGVSRNTIGRDTAVGHDYMKGAKIEMTGPLPRLT